MVKFAQQKSPPSFTVTTVTWLQWKRKGYFRLSQFHDSYLRKELGPTSGGKYFLRKELGPTSGEKYFEQIMELVLYTGRHTSIHS